MYGINMEGLDSLTQDRIARMQVFILLSNDCAEDSSSKQTIFTNHLPLPFCKPHNRLLFGLGSGAADLGDLIYTLVIWNVYIILLCDGFRYEPDR